MGKKKEKGTEREKFEVVMEDILKKKMGVGEYERGRKKSKRGTAFSSYWGASGEQVEWDDTTSVTSFFSMSLVQGGLRKSEGEGRKNCGSPRRGEERGIHMHKINSIKQRISCEYISKNEEDFLEKGPGRCLKDRKRRL